MAYSLIWLPQVLKNAGLKVAVVDNSWETRGRGDMGQVSGVICHHTAGSKNGNMPSLNTLINGRSDLPGPLSQLGLGRDGTFYVIAAGRCNHAGRGSWQGITTGNSSFIGIEAENTGRQDDSWPQVQLEAYYHGVAAILRHISRRVDFCAGHKEYALPRGRKNDPSFDMNSFRTEVARIMNDSIRPEIIPSLEPTPATGSVARPTLRRDPSVESDLVKEIQRKLGLNVDGKFGPKTETKIREFQRSKGLVPDGIVGPKTWKELDKI